MELNKDMAKSSQKAEMLDAENEKLINDVEAIKKEAEAKMFELLKEFKQEPELRF